MFFSKKAKSFSFIILLFFLNQSAIGEERLSVEDANFKIEKDFLENPVIERKIKDEIHDLSIIADDLIEKGLWENSFFQKRYGFILNSRFPDKYEAPNFQLDENKAKQINRYLDSPEDYIKHVVDDPTRDDFDSYKRKIKEAIDSGTIVPNTFQENATTNGYSGVAILAGRDALSKDIDGNYSFFLEKLLVDTPTKKSLEICRGEDEHVDFNVLTDSYCTGFLSEYEGEQVFVTARHCTKGKNSKDIHRSYVIFGFTTDMLDSSNDNKIQSKFVYKLDQAVIKGQSSAPEDDYAVYRIRKHVPSGIAKPIVLDFSATYNINREIALIGHPNGSTKKIDQDSAADPPQPAIIKNETNTIRISSDSNHGDSGSPILDLVNGKAIGILISGKNDFVEHSDKKCAISQVTPDVINSYERALKVSVFN